MCLNDVIRVTYLTNCHFVPLHTKKASGTVEVQLHAFLTSALYGGELPVFFALANSLLGKEPNKSLHRSLCNCTTGLDVLNREKYHSSLVDQAKYPLTTFSDKSVVTVQKPCVSKIPISGRSVIVTIIIYPPPLTQRNLNIYVRNFTLKKKWNHTFHIIITWPVLTKCSVGVT